MTDQQPKAQIAIKCLIKVNPVFIAQLIHLIDTALGAGSETDKAWLLPCPGPSGLLK